MNNDELVELFYKHLIDESLNDYKEIYLKTETAKVKDPYYKEAIPFFQGLSNDHQQLLLKIIKQTQIDTVSYFLGILDGTSTLDSNIEFDFTLKNQTTKLNGDLQDYFLELVEEKE
jgi:hemerythrin superfamily protein